MKDEDKPSESSGKRIVETHTFRVRRYVYEDGSETIEKTNDGFENSELIDLLDKVRDGVISDFIKIQK